MRETEDGADPCQAIPDGDHDFDVAEGALAHMRHASRTVLAELSTVLDVLRSEEQDAEHASTTVPPPGLSRLTAMLDSPAAVGLRVEHLQKGEARTPPYAVDLGAYRTVQEALANAHKHGSEPAARLRRDYTPAGLGIMVENAAGRPVPGADGCDQGFIGPRERGSSVGGASAPGATTPGSPSTPSFPPHSADTTPPRDDRSAARRRPDTHPGRLPGPRRRRCRT